MAEIPNGSASHSPTGVPVSAPMANGGHVSAPMATPQSQGLNLNPISNILADPMNPYFLHPSENPGTTLVSTPLNEHVHK